MGKKQARLKELKQMAIWNKDAYIREFDNKNYTAAESYRKKCYEILEEIKEIETECK